MRPTPAGHTNEDLIRMYNEGMTVRQIAATTRMSYGGTHNRLVAAGVRFRPTGGVQRRKDRQ